MTIENMTEDFVGIAEKSKEKTSSRLTRREFLKIVGLGTGAFAVSNSWLGEYLGGFNPEFNKIEGTLSEYKIGWQAKPWVWTNLTIASKRIDGMKIMPGEQISLNSLLGFDEMRSVSRENTDPRKGYVTAQMSNPAELDGWGYGLCLGSTAIFRACLNSPLQITERGTHYDIYSDYFKDMAIGTDAAVFKPDLGDILPETDLTREKGLDTGLARGLDAYPPGGGIRNPGKIHHHRLVQLLLRCATTHNKEETGMYSPKISVAAAIALALGTGASPQLASVLAGRQTKAQRR